jgi:hypothetical protein
VTQTANAWSHLPNARAIDQILELLETDTVSWQRNYGIHASLGKEVVTVRRQMDQDQDQACWALRRHIWNSAQPLGYVSAYYAAYDAVVALIAWPESVQLLTADPDQVRVWAQLGSLPARLMRTACIVWAANHDLVDQ